MTLRGLDRGERAALLINECQNAMVDPEVAGEGGLAGEAARIGLVHRIAELAQVCRELGVLVVHTTIVMRPDGVGTPAPCVLLGSLVKSGTVVQGRPGAEVHPALTPKPTDVAVQRSHGLTPFHCTELEPVLRQRGVQTVVVTGVSTNIGIPGACLEAVNRGFTAVVPQDCTAAAWPEAQEWQVRHTLPLLATVTTAAQVQAALRRSAAAGAGGAVAGLER